MKTKKQTLAIALTTFILFMLTAINSQSQINFEGFETNHEGLAAWDADGTGPEPAAWGHNVPLTGFTNQPYYGATRDYVDPDPDAAGFHLGSIGDGFPMFAQALADNGFTPEQVKVKFGLCSLEDDLEGVDWLIIDNMYYTNYYNLGYQFNVDGEPMISGLIGYLNVSINTSGGTWFSEYSFTKPTDASGFSSVGVQEVANAFLQDLAGEEMYVSHNLVTYSYFSGTNGRDGRYMNVTNGIIQKGLPTIPYIGLATDHEGTAAWNADGTGPEPLRDGHQNYGYYGASRDYDGIDPDPNAAFGHFLDNAEGFTNFYLQMEYRGYSPEQIKIKAGICDLNEDIEGEDWFGEDTLNYYHSLMRVELNGEPLFGFMVDTLNFIYGSSWNIITSPAIAYNASENSSPDIQLIADGFFKDLEMRQLNMEFVMSYVSGSINSNGRVGAFYQIDNGNLTAKNSNCTRIYEGNVSGTWMASCSPYIIEGDITIPNGETLTLEPGVWVKSMENGIIDIQGRIVAQGDNSNTGGIVFTAVNPDAGWGGVEFSNTGTTNDSSFFTNTIFEYGYAQGGAAGFNSGGAIAVKNFSKINIDHCLFKYNWADKSGSLAPSGGAIALWFSSPLIQNSEFYYNHAEYGGAIIAYMASHPKIERSLFHHNTANTDGGAIINFTNCVPDFTNCTFVKNTAAANGGAVDVYDGSKPNFINCIFFDNIANQGKQISVTSADCILDINYCDVAGGEAGIGPNGIGAAGTYENNIDEDPAFYEFLAFDYHLSNASPCVNAGDPSIFDPDGTISDMGALYFSIPEPPVALDPLNIANISFTAVWEVDLEVLGCVLDVATDAGFTDLVPGYDSLDVGYAYFYDVTVPEPGMPYYYRVRAYNAAGLSAASNTILVLLTGMEENMSENLSGLSIVPNPVSNNGDITFTLKDASEVQIEIFNYTGRKILSLKPGKQQEGQVSIPVNFNLLPSGSYVCRITTYKSIHTTKFVKILN